MDGQAKNSFQIIYHFRSVLATLSQDDDRKQHVASLAAEYGKLLDIIITSDVKRHAEGKKAHANHLSSQASVAAFLAGVQMGFIAFTAGVHDNPTSRVDRVINIFSFCAVSFDALGALFALTTAQHLQTVVSGTSQFMQEKADIDERVYLVLPGTVEGRVLDLKDEIKGIQNMTTKVQGAYRQAARLGHIIKKHAVDNDAALLVIILGMACFFVSLITFIITRQPMVVWVPTVIAVGVAAAILLRNEVRYSHMGRWDNIRHLFGIRMFTGSDLLARLLWMIYLSKKSTFERQAETGLDRQLVEGINKNAYTRLSLIERGTYITRDNSYTNNMSALQEMTGYVVSTNL